MTTKGKAEEVLSPRQHKVIQALLVERNHKEAALAAGVPLRSLQHWLANPVFTAEYKRQRRLVDDEYAHRVGLLGQEALDALQRNLKCGKEAVEVRAGIGLLQHRQQVYQMQELKERLDELERQLQETAAQAQAVGMATQALDEEAGAGDREPGLVPVSVAAPAQDTSEEAPGPVSSDDAANALDAFLAGADPGSPRNGFLVP